MNEQAREKPETAISDEARRDRQRAEAEVTERRRRETEPDPHHELTNPVEDADPTEFPDPYERRPDPRDPDEAERGDEAPQDPSTSDPPPPRNIDRLRDGEGSER